MVRLRRFRSPSAPLKILDRVAELSAARDFAALSQFMLNSLPHIVDCDWCSYNEVRTTDSKVIIHSGRMKTTSRDELNRLVGAHPLVHQVRTLNCPTTFLISEAMTRAEYHRSTIYTDMFAPLGVEYQLCLSVNSSDNLRAMIVGFQRVSRDFTIADRQLLEWIAPHLRNAWGGVQLVENLSNQIAIRDGALDSKSISLISLGAGQRIESIDASARARLKRFYPDWNENSLALPETLRLLLARLKLSNQSEADIDRDPWRLSVRLLPPGCLLPSRDVDVQKEREVLLLEERRVRLNEADLRIAGLTPRESEILYWVSEGKSDPAIATILDCSPRTVHKHVEHILKKLNVESRTSAAARALEQLSH